MLCITRITLIMLLPLLLLQSAIGDIAMAQSIEDKVTAAPTAVHAPNMSSIRRLRSTRTTRQEIERELQMIVTMEEFSRLLRLKNGGKRSKLYY
jgi:hypothetical protein